MFGKLSVALALRMPPQRCLQTKLSPLKKSDPRSGLVQCHTYHPRFAHKERNNWVLAESKQRKAVTWLRQT